MKQKPWTSWENKTEQEEEAIKSLRAAKKIILNNIPKNKILAIYVGGSFIRREMTQKSDVDTWTIVKDNKLLSKFEKLEKEYKEKYKPNLSLRAFSLWELKNNERYLKRKKPRANPGRFVKKIKNYFLIYGKPLNTKDFIVRSDEEDLKKLIKAFNKTFLPLYEKGKLRFSDILKQVFWLVELEQKIKGKEVPYSWKKLVRSIENKNHIIHEALKFRVKRIKDEGKRKRFIVKLKKYLKSLEGK